MLRHYGGKYIGALMDAFPHLLLDSSKFTRVPGMMEEREREREREREGGRGGQERKEGERKKEEVKR